MSGTPSRPREDRRADNRQLAHGCICRLPGLPGPPRPRARRGLAAGARRRPAPAVALAVVALAVAAACPARPPAPSLSGARRPETRLLTVVTSRTPAMTASDTPAPISGTGTGPRWSMP